MIKDDDKKIKIFIVDDDKFLLEMYSMKFTQSGFKVSTSSSSQEALDRLKEGLKPGLILLDIVMPSMDGFQFMEERNKKALSLETKIIMLTNMGEQIEIDKAMKLGASGYIIKASATPSEVVGKVKEILKK